MTARSELAGAPAARDLRLATPLRPDLLAIAEMVPNAGRVLDLGCGNGELLEYLVHHKGVKGRGIELSEVGVLTCVRRGLVCAKASCKKAWRTTRPAASTMSF